MDWTSFEKWLAQHGIEGKRCDRIEMVLGKTVNSDVAVWLEARQLMMDEDGKIVFDQLKKEPIWEIHAVPLVSYPQQDPVKGSSENPIRWEDW